RCRRDRAGSSSTPTSRRHRGGAGCHPRLPRAGGDGRGSRGGSRGRRPQPRSEPLDQGVRFVLVVLVGGQAGGAAVLPLVDRRGESPGEVSAQAFVDGTFGCEPTTRQPIGVVPGSARADEGVVLGGHQQKRCMIRRSTGPWWGWRNAWGTVPTMVKPRDSQRWMAAALVATTALNWRAW